MDGDRFEALDSKTTGGEIICGRLKTNDATLLSPRAQRSKRAKCVM